MKTRRRNRKDPQLITACCVCGRVQDGDAWVRDKLDTSIPRTHTYCPKCLVVEVRRNFPDSVKTVLALCKAS